jgi:excinuclease UvrABC ATPase subunit
VLAPVALTDRLSWEEQAGHLQRAGYTRVLLGDEVTPLDPLPKLKRGAKSVKVVIDRFRWAPGERERLVDSCEQGFRRGEGRIELRIGARSENRSERWECAHCGTPATRPSRRCSRSTARPARARPAAGSATCSRSRPA